MALFILESGAGAGPCVHTELHRPQERPRTNRRRARSLARSLASVTHAHSRTPPPPPPTRAGSLSALGPMANLTTLSLAHSRDVCGSLSDLAPLLHLRHLDLHDCEWLSGSLQSILHLNELETLVLARCRRIEGSLQCLEAMERMRHLVLENCFQITGGWLGRWLAWEVGGGDRRWGAGTFSEQALRRAALAPSPLLISSSHRAAPRHGRHHGEPGEHAAARGGRPTLLRQAQDPPDPPRAPRTPSQLPDLLQRLLPHARGRQPRVRLAAGVRARARARRLRGAHG